jgi:amidase
MTDPAFQTASQWATEILSRRIGCLELLDLYLARVVRFNPTLNAIIAMRADQARERARAADMALARDENWGPLHGIPMTIKESFDVAGLPTTFGNPALKDNIARHDAVLAARLTAAGAVIFGKTNVPLLLADSQSYNAIYGTTNNPWDLSRTPGGSSGGSAAALAAGLTALDAGSDIGGSLRNPAHYCGIYAHKPTHGIVPPRGHATPGILSPSDLSVVGPMGRSAEDLALGLAVVAGADPLLQAGWRLDLPTPRRTRLEDFRIAVWAEDQQSPVDRAVLDRLQAAIDRLAGAGAHVDVKARPAFASEHSNEVYMTLLRAVTASRHPPAVFEEQRRIVASLPPTERSYRAYFARGATLYHRHWIEANEARTKLRKAWREFFQDYDVLLAPIAQTPAFPHQQGPDFDNRTLMIDGRPVPYITQLFWAGLATVAYLPATAAPLGLTPAGLPVGVQIVGPEFGDHTTIAFARHLAEAIGGFVPPPGYA